MLKAYKHKKATENAKVEIGGVGKHSAFVFSRSLFSVLLFVGWLGVGVCIGSEGKAGVREGKHDRYKHVCTWLFLCLCTKGMCHVCQSGPPMGLFLCLFVPLPLWDCWEGWLPIEVE